MTRALRALAFAGVGWFACGGVASEASEEEAPRPAEKPPGSTARESTDELTAVASPAIESATKPPRVTVGEPQPSELQPSEPPREVATTEWTGLCPSSLALGGSWWSEGALVKVTFREGASTIQFGFLDEQTERGIHSEPGWTFWTWGADDCCPDPTTSQDDWRWEGPGVEPPLRCADVASPADDQCTSAHAGVTNIGVSPVTGVPFSLDEVCSSSEDATSEPTGSEDAGAGTIAIDGGVPGSADLPTTPRRSFQFRATDAWQDFCAGADAVACSDVLDHTELTACDADYLCNYRYGEFGDNYSDPDLLIDACTSYAVCSCDAQGCSADPRFAWRYSFEAGKDADQLFARVAFVDTLTGSVVFESVGLTLQRLPD